LGGPTPIGGVWKAIPSSSSHWESQGKIWQQIPQQCWVAANSDLRSLTSHNLCSPQPILSNPPQNLRVKPEGKNATLPACPPSCTLWVMIPVATSPAPEIVRYIGRGPAANRRGSVVSYDPF
jgi:hypothetical protein